MSDVDEHAWEELCQRWASLEQSVSPSTTEIAAASHTEPKYMNAFGHGDEAPLHDASRQIRLLRFAAPVQPGVLSCELHVFNIKPAASRSATVNLHREHPPYATFSYTWGCLDDARTIYVDGRSQTIGANCYYALEQASCLQGVERGYFWIDSLCINQHDLQERSQQVRIMGDIYRQANVVLVCLGPHHDDSDFLFSALSGLEYTKTCRHGSKRSAYEVEQSISRGGEVAPAMDRFSLALHRLGTRDYWRRLWIVQEITLARSVLLLCGEAQLSLRAFIRAVHTTRHCNLAVGSRGSVNRINLARPIANALQQALPCPRQPDRPGLSLVEALQNFGLCQCKDIRDRVYGLRSIISWPSGLPELMPDYSLSIEDLAVQLLPYLAAGDHGQMAVPAVQALVKGLELSPASARIIIDKLEHHTTNCRPDSGVMALQSLADGFRITGRACRLDMSSKDGYVTADLLLESATRVHSRRWLEHNPSIKGLNKIWHDMHRSGLSSPDTTFIETDGQLVGVASAGVQSGDYLAKAYPFWLILRPTRPVSAPESRAFSIIGQAWLGSVQLCPNDATQCKCEATTDLDAPHDRHVYPVFDVLLSFEDMFVLYSYCRQAGLRRSESRGEYDSQLAYLMAPPTRGGRDSHALIDETCSLRYDAGADRMRPRWGVENR